MVEYWKETFASTWAIFKSNLNIIITYASLLLVVRIIMFLIQTNLEVYQIDLLFRIIDFGLTIGFLNVLYLLVNNKSVSIQDLGNGLYYLLKISVPYLLIIIPGLIFFYIQNSDFIFKMDNFIFMSTENPNSELGIGGLILSTAFLIAIIYPLFFYPIIIIDQNLTVLDSVKKSMHIVKNNIGKIIQLLFISFVILLSFGLIVGPLLLSLNYIVMKGIIVEAVGLCLISPILYILYIKLYIDCLNSFSKPEVYESSS